MDVFVRQHMRMNSSQFQLPAEGSIYDYLYDTAQAKWIPWMDTVSDSAQKMNLNVTSGRWRLHDHQGAHAARVVTVSIKHRSSPTSTTRPRVSRNSSSRRRTVSDTRTYWRHSCYTTST